MAISYNHRAIEEKWRRDWEEHPINVEGDKEKYYCLDMFPYPSGNGLHVGHWRGYVISDAWSRYKMMQGYYVIHPMGWDAFGLPAENYAIKTGQHPRISTEANIKNIKKQIKQIAAIYDWDREVDTTDPNYYKWTQWIFVQLFKKGLAYEKEFPLNWCPSCKAVLANEEVVNGCCERCGTPVTKKNLRQWMLKITEYADRLLEGLDRLEWPEKVKKMQTDWIGKSYGAEVDFPVDGREEKIKVYTTRPDTLYGATFMVLSPEHELTLSLATDETRAEVEKYIACLIRIRPVCSPDPTASIRSMVRRSRSGLLTMYCPITVPAPSCAYRHTMTVTSHSPRSSDFRSSRSFPRTARRLRT